MWFDSTNQGGPPDETAKLPQTSDDETAEEFTWYEMLHSGLLAVIGAIASVIGLNVVFDGTGSGPLSTMQLVAVGLILIVVMCTAVGAYGVIERYRIGMVASFLTTGFVFICGLAVTVMASAINGKMMGVGIMSIGAVLLMTSVATWQSNLALRDATD